MIGKQYEYDAMSKCEKELWWYRNPHDPILKKISQFLCPRANILDARCGTLEMISQLRQNVKLPVVPDVKLPPVLIKRLTGSPIGKTEIYR